MPSALPAEFTGWSRINQIPEDAVAAQLGADQVLEWTFQRSQGPISDLFVAWFRSQRAGTVQPHSPLICIPGNGWNIETSHIVELSTAAGTLRASLLLASKDSQQAAILYWYQTAFRAEPGEWQSKLWMAADMFRQKRTDIALVRVVAYGEGGQPATATASSFASDAYPVVRAWLPR
jgi:EpsI family protein